MIWRRFLGFILLLCILFIGAICLFVLLQFKTPEQAQLELTQTAAQTDNQATMQQATADVILSTQGAYSVTQNIIHLTQTLQANKTLIAELTSEYIDIPHLRDVHANVAPYITGKIIIIDTEPPIQVDMSVSATLPQEQIAHNPSEVGTIIWIACKNNGVGIYTDGAVGYQTTCDVTVIDKAKALIVGKQTFVGSLPPTTKEGPGDRFGGTPVPEIIQYVKSLPQQ